jgi:hypothetical protein
MTVHKLASLIVYWVICLYYSRQQRQTTQEVAVRVRQKPTRPDLLKLWTLVYGAEGDGEGADGEGDGEGQASSSGTGSTAEGQESNDGDDEGDGDDGDEMVPMSVVKKLRSEAAKYRVQAREAQDKLSEKEKAEMSEAERAKVEAEEAKAEAENLRSELRRERFQSALMSEASNQKFTDPTDVIALISQEDITIDEDGTPNRKSLKAAIERIAKAKPYLLTTTNSGSGDGGSRGSQPSDTDRLKRHEQEIQSRGGVKIAG